MRQHFNQRHGGLIYRCPHCRKKFKRGGDLKRHVGDNAGGFRSRCQTGAGLTNALTAYCRYRTF